MLDSALKGINFLELLKNEFKRENIEIWNIKQVLNGKLEAFEDKLEEAEAFVIGAPLYVDSNLGFYEGEQIVH